MDRTIITTWDGRVPGQRGCVCACARGRGSRRARRGGIPRMADPGPREKNKTRKSKTKCNPKTAILCEKSVQRLGKRKIGRVGAPFARQIIPHPAPQPPRAAARARPPAPLRLTAPDCCTLAAHTGGQIQSHPSSVVPPHTPTGATHNSQHNTQLKWTSHKPTPVPRTHIHTPRETPPEPTNPLIDHASALSP